MQPYLKIKLSMIAYCLFATACGGSSFSGSSGGKKKQPQTTQPAAASGEAISPTGPSENQFDAPSHAVTQGSFTVWAEPRVPPPGSDYQIIVLVDLPGGTSGYSENDLSGHIQGTDSYQQDLKQSLRWNRSNVGNFSLCGPFNRAGCYSPNQPNLQVEGKQAKLSIWVPGALDTITQDTVSVRSAVLKESQTVTVNFR